MPRKANPWWLDRPTLRKRLAGFNAQGARYGKSAIPLADLERRLAKASPTILSACCYCGRKLEKKGPAGASLDHTVPLAHKGEHSLDNACFSCSNCNKLKGAWSADFYIEFVGFLMEKGKWADFCRGFRRKY